MQTSAYTLLLGLVVMPQHSPPPLAMGQVEPAHVIVARTQFVPLAVHL
jgi:hypothetical protein